MTLKAFLNEKVFSLFPRLGMGNIKQKFNLIVTGNYSLIDPNAMTCCLYNL